MTSYDNWKTTPPDEIEMEVDADDAQEWLEGKSEDFQEVVMCDYAEMFLDDKLPEDYKMQDVIELMKDEKVLDKFYEWVADKYVEEIWDSKQRDDEWSRADEAYDRDR